MKYRGRAGQYSALYTVKRWRAIRARQLKAHPLCEFCKARGKVEAATICDHIEPHKGDMVRFWAGPFQSLCKTCHDSTKQAIEHGARAFGADGTPIGGW